MKTHFAPRLALMALLVALTLGCSAWSPKPAGPRKILVLTEEGGVHGPYVAGGQAWLKQFAAVNKFTIDTVHDTEKMNDAFLANYRAIIQLNYPPYAWTDTAKAAFVKYIDEGKGGWVGFHHATLLGDFDGYKLWPWFSDFMGGIVYKNYIPGFARATVNIEDKKSPVMKGVPASFEVLKDEWYTYDKSPRPHVHVLASVDESTYVPDSKLKMGDHPVVWTNDKKKARNIYIFMGHDKTLWENEPYKKLVRNAILWAAGE